MSNILTHIEGLKSKMKMIEGQIAQAATQAEQWTKNHAGLTGMLQGTKEALEEAEKIANGINEVNNIVTPIIDAVE